MLPKAVTSPQIRKEIAMLEVRSAYGYYGETGGVTGENPPKPTIRMPYRDYKRKYADTHETVRGSYDPSTKTIEVVFTEEEIDSKQNLGKRYELDAFYFVMDDVEVCYAYEGMKKERRIVSMRAKTRENAIRNAKKKAREWGAKFVREATVDDRKVYKVDYYGW